MHDLPARPKYTYSEEDWIQIRAHFMSSILADLHLHKLAQNIGASWPLRDLGETAAKYLEFSFDELAAAPGLDGHPARLQLLLDILERNGRVRRSFSGNDGGKSGSRSGETRYRSDSRKTENFS